MTIIYLLQGWEHEISKSLQASQILATKSQKAYRLCGPLKLKTNHHFVRKHFNCIAPWIHKISVSILDITQHYKMFFFSPKDDRPAGHVLKSRLAGMPTTADTLTEKQKCLPTLAEYVPFPACCNISGAI